MTYWISRDISFQRPLRVEHEGPPPCLWCGEPVLSPSMDGPLVCGPCDSNGGAVWADGVLRGTPRITPVHRQHFRYCIDHIVATQPEGRYPTDAGPEWFAGREIEPEPEIPKNEFKVEVKFGDKAKSDDPSGPTLKLRIPLFGKGGG